MIEFLQSIWSPVAAAGGVVFGVLVGHVWTRIRGRVVTLRWTYAVNRVAASGEDSRFGRVDVLYNDNPVQNLFMVHVDVSNESHADLGDVELQVGFRDGSLILSEGAEVRGSLALLSFSETYQAAIERYRTLEEGEDPGMLQVDLYRNRFFAVPSLTRGATIGMSFLVHADPGITPRPLVYCEAKGVKLREQPPKPQLLGVPQDAAGLSGTALGIVSILVASFWLDFPVALVLIAFLVGAFAELLGVAAIYLKRWVGRVIG